MIAGNSIEGAIVASICYLDVFACAPRAAEIHRFLMGRKASRADVERTLRGSPGLAKLIAERDGFWFLRGKPHLVPRRIRFLEHSQKAWPKARRMAEIIARTGLARCALVTGSLAADNSDEHADVDFLLIYPAPRVWSSFALVRLLAKSPGLAGMRPNYALPDDHLEVQPQNLFTAWEIAKSVPLFGFETYHQWILANRWVLDYLPNALPLLEAPLPEPIPSDPAFVRAITRTAAFARLEEAERRRKFEREERDAGGRHTPTRSFQALAELRYRLELFGLVDHPLYARLVEWTSLLGNEMQRWGDRRIGGLTGTRTAPKADGSRHELS